MAAAKNHTKKGEPVSLVEEIHRQKRAKKWRRRRLFLGVLLCIVAYVSGAFAAFVSLVSGWHESATIALATQSGFPVQTGLSAVYQVEELAGGFVALGPESCVTYSAGGNQLRNIQSGYLRPDIAVGGSRYLLYNCSGKELRVESRTETIYTKTYTNSIMLAGISENNNVAVVTESDRYLATLTMYSANMVEQLSYSMTEREGIPLCIQYSPDNKTLAMASISASNGRINTNIHLVQVGKGTVSLMACEQATPMAMQWISKTKLLVFYDNMLALYDTETSTRLASYAYQNKIFADYAVYGDTVALLFAQGTQSEFVLLDETLTVQAQGNVALANRVALSETELYFVYEKQIDVYSYQGEPINQYQSEQKILALLQAKHQLLFTANETSIFTLPQET